MIKSLNVSTMDRVALSHVRFSLLRQLERGNRSVVPFLKQVNLAIREIEDHLPIPAGYVPSPDWDGDN